MIYGAGEAGRLFSKVFLKNKIYNVCGFLDDNKKIQNTYIEGLEVYGKQDIISVLKVFKIQVVIFAMPSINNKKLNRIIKKIF